MELRLLIQPNFSTKKFDEIDLALGTYENILGLFVSNYRIFYSDRDDPLPIQNKENSTLFQVKPALEPRETTIMWKNSNDKKLPKQIVDAFMDYSSNLAKLDSLNIPQIVEDKTT